MVYIKQTAQTVPGDRAQAHARVQMGVLGGGGPSCVLDVCEDRARGILQIY